MIVPQRRRLVATAAIVSALAFGVGWVLGQGGSHDVSKAAQTITTSLPAALPGSTLPSVDDATGSQSPRECHRRGRPST